MASPPDTTKGSRAQKGVAFVIVGFLMWVGGTALGAVLDLVDLFSWRKSKPGDPDASGTGGIGEVAGLPINPIDMPANRQFQTDVTNPPVASDEFMGKKIEGLRPATLDRTRAE